MSRRSTRNLGNKVNYSKPLKNYKEDDIKDVSNMSENDDSDSQDGIQERKLRKHVKVEIKEEIHSDDSENPPKRKLRKHVKAEFKEETDSDDSENPPKRTKGFGRVEDSEDEDYDPNEQSDDDYYDRRPRTKKMKEQKEPKIKRELTEYEKMVEKNRQEKMAFLQSLKFEEVKESLSVAVKSLKDKHKPVKRIPSGKPSGPVRKSLRLRKDAGSFDYSEAGLAARMEAERQEEIQKKLPEVLPFENAIQETDSYEDFNEEYKNLYHSPTESFNEHLSHLETMQLPESQIAKVVGSRITSMTFHPMKERILLAASSKYGQIGFWQVDSGQDSYVFTPHTEGITNVKFNPKLPQFIVSSSYDGTLRCGDLEKGVFNEAYNVSEETCCTFFDFLSHSTFLVGQKNGIVSLVDHRQKLKAACKKHQCHDESVKSVSVHPVDNSYFVTAGQRGTIKLWDLRKLQSKPIVEVQHHKRCVQSAFFSPLTGKHVLTTSNDDSICIFDSSNLGKSLSLKHSMKHNNQTGRWLTTFRSTWLPNTDSAFVVGSMLYPRRIEVYDDEMFNIFNFRHDNLGCITSVNIFHPSLPVLAGANSSGKVYVFNN